MSISGTIKATVALVDTGTPDFDGATLVDPLSYALSQTFANGVGADQINFLWHDRRTLAGSANESIDLTGLGAPTNYRNEGMTLARVKLLLIKNRSSVNAIQFGPPANGWLTFINVVGTEAIIPLNGAVLAYAPGAAGWTVTAGTGDLLFVENLGGTSTDYDIIIGGGLT